MRGGGRGRGEGEGGEGRLLIAAQKTPARETPVLVFTENISLVCKPG